MMQRHRQLRSQVFQLKDAALFSLALWLAHFIIWQFDLFSGRMIEPFSKFAWLYVVLVPAVPLVLDFHGFYNRPLMAPRAQTFWILFKGCLTVTVGVVLVMFFLKITLSRAVIFLFGVLSFALVFGKEELLRAWYKSKLGQQQLRRRFILVGTREDTLRMRTELRRKPEEPIEIVGELDLNETAIEDLVHMLHDYSANGVILNAKHTYFGQIEKAIQACETEGVEAWLVADFFRTHISRTSFDDFYGRPVLVFRCVPEASWQSVCKQVIDLVGSFLAIILLTPLWILVAALIKITSPGDILFRQQRAGVNGQPFTMLKFRSMVSDAEQRKQELAALNEMEGPVFKIANDPRITPVGRVLRKYSIDELPQLFNVLKGEMSLVGPRPLPLDEVKRFDEDAHRRRLSVRPGLTCLWQISGRNNVTNFKEWVKLDLEYIDNWSLWLDIKILFLTIPVVIAGTGAK